MIGGVQVTSRRGSTPSPPLAASMPVTCLIACVMVCLAAGLSACGDDTPTAAASAQPAAAAARVDEARLARADEEPQNWYATNRGSGEDHYSPLDQINQDNVGSLGFAWQYDTHTTRGLEASPLVIDGVLYTSGNWGKVYALDAKTGKELWTYDPRVPGEWGRRPCCDIVNRGVAAWKGRIYVGSLDGFLIALDAGTGREIWRADTLVDRTRYQTITGAPKIAGDKVIIGNGGAELGVRGYVSAYDVQTGRFAWRFFIVPGDPRKPFEHPELEAAAKTWDPDSMWDVGGGGTAWDAMAYDPKLDLLYVGTGNGSPHARYSRSPRGGDNLFLSSILAIHPKTGRLAWHYQTTPGDSWDYNAKQHMILADLPIGGRKRQVLMQAPKNGFFYVLDRSTGELLSAEKYGKATWATHVDLATGRPAFTRQSDYSRAPKLIYPGQPGAHNWHPMSSHRGTGLVYLNLIEAPDVYAFAPKPRYAAGESNEHVDIIGYDDPRIASTEEVRLDPDRLSFLQAWDPVRREERWRIPIDRIRGGGVLSTAGNLVFMGNGRGFLNVFDAKTGAQLAALNVGTSMQAAPISYAVGGEQYVAIMAGIGGSYSWAFPRGSAAYRYGNAGRIIAFKLGGGAVPLPPKVDRDAPIPVPPEVPTSPEMIARGALLFDRARCSWCHSGAPGVAPNVFALSTEKHRIFKDIVLRGALEARGMASFADVLSDADADALHAYIVDRTRRDIEARAGR